MLSLGPHCGVSTVCLSKEKALEDCRLARIVLSEDQGQSRKRNVVSAFKALEFQKRELRKQAFTSNLPAKPLLLDWSPLQAKERGASCGASSYHGGGFR